MFGDLTFVFCHTLNPKPWNPNPVPKAPWQETHTFDASLWDLLSHLRRESGHSKQLLARSVVSDRQLCSMLHPVGSRLAGHVRPVGKAGEHAESSRQRLNYDVLPTDFLVLLSKPLTGNRPRNR